MLFSDRKERTRIESYVEATVPMYFFDDFKRSFRMSRSTFEIVCRHLTDYRELLPTWSGGREHITVEKQLLIILWYLGTQDTTHSMADRFNVTESSIVRCRDKVFRVFMVHLKKKILIWPQGDEIQKVVDAFHRKANFPGVIGAIDGTHIRIRAPKEYKEVYVNRKGFHSIVLQAVCREDLRFIHVEAGWAGSTHDARVLKTSDLWNNGLAWCGDGHLIGDAAYPVRKWLLAPYRDNGHLTVQQKAFNYSLSSTRVTVERSFGFLKGRFPRLQYMRTRRLKTAVRSSVVCTMLQNICLANEDEMQDYFDSDELPALPNLPGNLDNEGEGAMKRDQIAQNL